MLAAIAGLRNASAGLGTGVQTGIVKAVGFANKPGASKATKLKDSKPGRTGFFLPPSKPINQKRTEPTKKTKTISRVGYTGKKNLSFKGNE